MKNLLKFIITFFFYFNSLISMDTQLWVQKEINDSNELKQSLKSKYNLIQTFNFDKIFPHQKPVTQLIFSKDNKYLITISGSTGPIIWDIKSGEMIHQFKVHKNKIKFMRINYDGQFLVTGDEYQSTGNSQVQVIVWDLNAITNLDLLNLPYWPLDAHAGILADLEFAEHSNIIALANKSGAYLYDLGQYLFKLIQTPFCNQPSMSKTKFIPNTNYIITLPDEKFKEYTGWRQMDRTPIIWDIQTGNVVRELNINNRNKTLYDLIVSPDGKYIITLELIQLLEGKNTIKRSSNIILWDVETGNIIREIYVSTPVTNIAFSHNSKYLGFTTCYTTNIFDLSKNNLIHSFDTNCYFKNFVLFSPDDKYFITKEGRKLYTLTIRNTETGEILTTLHESNKDIIDCCFSSNGQYLAASSDDNNVYIWDFANILNTTNLNHKDLEIHFKLEQLKAAFRKLINYRQLVETCVEKFNISTE